MVPRRIWRSGASSWSEGGALVARKQALGRGLKALIPEAPRARSGLAELPLDAIRPNPEQPRVDVADGSLDELAASIREHGVLQPLLVSEGHDGTYTLIAGERRLRAARIAGLSTVPAVIRERLDARTELELALVENLQRRDLSPIEEALAFEHLRSEFGLSQAEIARRVGFDRSTVANALRLLKLPEEVRRSVQNGGLSAGHARALLSLPEDDRVRWAERVAETGMSVRELERAAAERRPTQQTQGSRDKPDRDPNLVAAEERLARCLGVNVSIQDRSRGGRIIITCRNSEDLQRVFEHIVEGRHGAGDE